MIRLRSKYTIQTLLVATLAVALVLGLFLPHKPTVEFSTPALAPPTRDGVYETAITNHSIFPIWYGGDGSGRVLTFSCELSTDEQSGGYRENSSESALVPLYCGETAKIRFSFGSGWNSGRIGVEVFDWANRSFNCQSELFALD